MAKHGLTIDIFTVFDGSLYKYVFGKKYQAF